MPKVEHIVYACNKHTNFEYVESHRYIDVYIKHDDVKFCIKCGAENAVYTEDSAEDTQTCICMSCRSTFEIDANCVYTIDTTEKKENNHMLNAYLQLKEYDEQ